MKKYVFYRNDFTYAEDFYRIIQKTLLLPEWFGKNADALWDMLTGYIETPCEITFIGFDRNESKYNKSIIDAIIKCFLDVQKEYPEEFKIIIL